MRHFVSVSIGLFVATVAAAQTTWTSFEDRRGHAIASDPAGGVVMFGGESTSSAGNLLADTNAFTNSGPSAAWSRLVPTARPTARSEHAMASAVGTDDTAIFILFGGLAVPPLGGPPAPSDETFVYEGGGWGNVGNLALRPAPRTGHAMVTDPIRNTVVLFGGFSSGIAQSDLWEFDPVNRVWLQHFASGQSGSPATRYDHAMAYHPGQAANDGRVYVFGGTGFKFDTWELNLWTSPPTWTNVTPSTRPSGRRRCAMAYLPTFDNIVMFGGEDNTLTPLGDTWVWDRYAGTWTQRTPTTQPPPRFNHAMAPDQLGNNVLLLGGEAGTGQPLQGTWLWNGVTWTAPLPQPAPRDGAAMAFDTARGRHVLFGGHGSASQADLNDTWELDGLNWRQRSPGLSPPPRTNAAISYDAVRQRTILYGGSQNGVDRGDTWEWNGTSWAPQAANPSMPAASRRSMVYDSVRERSVLPMGATTWLHDGQAWAAVHHVQPPQRFDFGMVYVASSDRVLLFGGQDFGNVRYGDTWSWDGRSWQQYNPPQSPPARCRFGLAYDSARDVVVLFGGIDTVLGVVGDTWTWDGSTWTNRGVAGPAPRFDTMLAFDSARQRGVLFGGLSSTSGTFGDTWEWDGSSWALRTTATNPIARKSTAMAFDPIRHVCVMFGGLDGNDLALGDLWEYDGSNWVDRTPSVLPPTWPPPQFYQSAAYDPASGRVVMANGAASSYFPPFAWDGSAWTQLPAPTGTPDRNCAAIAQCPTTRPGLLFFGGAQTPLAFDDAWVFEGSTWHPADVHPASRLGYAAAFDSRRQCMVLFGGEQGGNPLQDTWEWDGVAWRQRFPPAPRPLGRSHAAMAFDAARGVCVLRGGDIGGGTEVDDTWEWDGVVWRQRLPLMTSGAVSGHAMGFDAVRRVSVSFERTGTWDYGPTAPASTVPFGAGCPSSAGPLALAPKPWAGPWLGGRFECDITNAPANSLGIFVWGFSSTSWLGNPLPMSLAQFGSPTCFLRASDDVHEILLPATNPYVSFVLPNHSSFLGAVMYGQAGFFDAGLGGRIVTSNGLELTFGGR